MEFVDWSLVDDGLLRVSRLKTRTRYPLVDYRFRLILVQKARVQDVKRM